MIALAGDCLLFRLANGECVPFSPEMVSFELIGETASRFDSEFLQQAANAVFHYFKHELGRQAITVAEFAGALEKVLKGFKVQVPSLDETSSNRAVLESDLCQLAQESGDGCELVFFPRLREELRQHLQQEPRVLRFHGLRGCVKHLVGAQRWSSRCRTLQEQIVSYLRHCLDAEEKPPDIALLID